MPGTRPSNGRARPARPRGSPRRPPYREEGKRRADWSPGIDWPRPRAPSTAMATSRTSCRVARRRRSSPLHHSSAARTPRDRTGAPRPPPISATPARADIPPRLRAFPPRGPPRRFARAPGRARPRPVDRAATRTPIAPPHTGAPPAADPRAAMPAAEAASDSLRPSCP